MLCSEGVKTAEGVVLEELETRMLDSESEVSMFSGARCVPDESAVK